MTVADYPDWSVPQSSANAIAATGVPLLGSPNLLLSAAPAINAGATYVSPLLPVSQLGYEIALQPYETGSGSAAAVQVTMAWYDETDTYVISEESWYVWPGTVNGTHLIYGKGPAKGGNLVISIFNTSTAMQYTVPVQVWQRSHPYTRDDWRSQIYSATASGNLLAPNDITAGVIGTDINTLTTGASVTIELPLYSGPAYLWFQSQSNTSDCTCTIQDSTDPNAVTLGNKVMQFFTSSQGFYGAQIILPRYQCRVVLHNGNAATETVNFSLHIAEQSA